MVKTSGWSTTRGSIQAVKTAQVPLQRPIAVLVHWKVLGINSKGLQFEHNFIVGSKVWSNSIFHVLVDKEAESSDIRFHGWGGGTEVNADQVLWNAALHSAHPAANLSFLDRGKITFVIRNHYNSISLSFFIAQATR